MSNEVFIDHHEALQVSPNADLEMIERAFRLLARRYHPDNPGTGDAERFHQVLTAYRTLIDPSLRASYDVRHSERRIFHEAVAEAASSHSSFAADHGTRISILRLLYMARRRQPDDPGIGPVELENLLGCTERQLAFDIWYLKEKGWIIRTDSGQIAITADGVDKVIDAEVVKPERRYLPRWEEIGGERVPSAAASETEQG